MVNRKQVDYSQVQKMKGLYKPVYMQFQDNDVEEKSLGGILTSTAAGAGMGALSTSPGGPTALVGGIVGGVIGLGTGLVGHFRERKMEKEAAYQERLRVDMEKDKLTARNKFFASQMQDRSPNMSFAPTFPMGGYVGGPNVELEKEEVFQEPSGDMGKVNAPLHNQGGVEINLPNGTRIFSDDIKLKTSEGKTFADRANEIKRQMSKYEKILN